MIATRWIIRFLVIGLQYAYVLVYSRFLIDREKHSATLENPLFNWFLVVFYNAVCYVPMVIPSDPIGPGIPPFTRGDFLRIWYLLSGIISVCVGTFLLFRTLRLRNVIGAQDTAGTLFTHDVYGIWRHPIYVGISLNSLGLVLVLFNFDALLVFPFVLLGNFIMAKYEEQRDMIPRFGADYEAYRERVSIFGPWWFWVLLLGVVLFPLGVALI